MIIINIQKENIKDGIKLHFIETNAYKTNTFSIIIRNQLVRENATSIAVLSDIINNFENKYTLLKRLNLMYGGVFDASIVKKGDQQIILIYGDVINNFGEDICINVYKILLQALISVDKTIDEAKLSKAKEVVKSNIIMEEESKREYAVKKCLEIACEGEDFGVSALGYIEDIPKITIQNVEKIYAEMLEKSQIDIIISGKGSPKPYVKITNEMLDFNREKITQSKIKKNQTKPKEIKKETHRQNLNQSKLCIAARTGSKLGDDSFYGLCVLNEIFGGGGSSRLFAEIREKQGLCYYVSSFIYRLKELMIIEAGVDENSVEMVIDKVQETINSFAKGNFTEDEISEAKQSLIKKHEEAINDQSGLCDQYLNSIITEIEFDKNKFYEKINAVTKDDVISQANEITMDTIYLLTGGGEYAKL